MDIDNSKYEQSESGLYVEKTPHLIHDYSVESLSFTKLVNVQYFSEAATAFMENKKKGKPYYTLAPRGSREYEDFWKQEKDRCINGYQVGDLWIAGRYYHYLNYFPMLRVPKGTPKDVVTVEKEIEFPSFWLIQYLWKHFQLVAHHGGSFCGVDSEGGEDVVCLKTRGAGFSYMDAHDDVYNYTFISDSKTYAFAYSDEFLSGADGLMPKIQIGLDFHNTATGGVDKKGQFKSRWGHIRYDKSEEPLIFKAGAVSNSGEIAGFGSVIEGVICNRDLKIRGKRGRKVTIEEAGSFPTLPKIMASSLALVKDGGYKIGQRVMFGTGGEEGIGIQALEEVFWNPKAHGFMSFPDIFGGTNEKVGFFCPSYLANSMFINEDGTTDIKGAIEYEKKIRANKATASAETLDRHVAEYPFTPQEALKRLSNTVFNTKAINARIQILKADKSITDKLKHCDLKFNKKTNSVDILPNKFPPLVNYPHKETDSLESCVVIKQLPYKKTVYLPNGTTKKEVPDDMYFIVVDNYGVDESISKTSLFSCAVYKNYNEYDNEFAGVPVAWYTGRTNQQSDSFTILFNLARMYSATVSGEYNAQGQILINWAKHNKLTRYLTETPVVIGKEIKRRGFWEVVTTETKSANIKAIAGYLDEERGLVIEDDDYDENDLGYNPFGSEDSYSQQLLTNLDMYDDIAFLEECAKYKFGINADRISCHSLAYKRIKEKVYTETEKKLKSKETVADRFKSSNTVYEDDEGFVSIQVNRVNRSSVKSY